MAESNVKLRVDARDAVSALQQTNRASEKLNRELNTTNKRTATATANIQRFGISFRSVVGPMVALTGSLTLASRALNTFADREADLKVLSAQLTRIGAGGSKQIDELKAAADRLGDATLFSQDDFIQSFNILTSFRAIAVESFTDVSTVAADIAQVMGSDVKSATVQLAKALEDPKRGLTALSRSGITFNETQTETIKKLVDSGNLLDAQALILDTIKGQYEGAATAAGTGFAGAQDLLAENTRDLTEALGKGLEPAAAAVTTKLAELAGLLSDIPAPAGQAALALGGIALGVKAINVAITAFKATRLAEFIGIQIALYKTFEGQIYLTAAAQGALNLAVKAFPIAIAALAIGSLVKSLTDAKTAQDRFNDAMSDGSVEALKAAIAMEEDTLSVERNKGAKMSLLGINAKLLKSQQRLTQLRAALAEAEAKPKPDEEPEKPKPIVLDEDEAKRLARIAQASADRVRSLEQQTLLASALTEEERRQFERQIQIADILENKRGLSQEQLKTELEATLALHDAEDTTRRINEANETRLEQQNKLKEQMEEQKRKAEELDNAFRSGVVDAITAAIDGTKSLGEALVGVIKQMANLILQRKLLNALSGFSLTSFLGFANGGRPPVGRASIVGERGPELFVPDTAGTIIPNHQLGGGGGAMASNIVVNVDASGTSVEGNEGQSRQLGALIGAAVQTEIIKQQRPGGLLSR